MTHFAILSPAMTGHLNSIFPLARELRRRGHRVTFFQCLDAQAPVEAAGLDFWAIATPPIFPRCRGNRLWFPMRPNLRFSSNPAW